MTAVVTDFRARPAELLKQMPSKRLYQEAKDRHMSLSAFLEREDPSSEWGADNKLDAFERMLKAANIVTKSDAARGFQAHRFQDFDTDPAKRALVPEIINRAWMKGALGRDVSTRAFYNSQDQIPGTNLSPYYFDPNLYAPQIAPAIPLDQVVTNTQMIDGINYMAFYLTNDVSQEHLARVSEGAELPRVFLTGGKHQVSMKKFGRIIETTYEAVRRIPVDLVAFHVSRIAVRAQIDKVAAALDVLVNGDGNSGTAATVYNLTTLDAAATVGTLTLKAWLAFKMLFLNPYSLTTALAQTDVALQMELLNTGTANIPLVVIQGQTGLGSLNAINPSLKDGVALGWTADAPSGKIIGFDKRFAVQHLIENGSDISETDRWMETQRTALSISEVNGFHVIDPAAVKVLNLAA